MLLEYIKEFYDPDTTYSKVIIPRYDRYVTTLTTRSTILRDRHLKAQGYEAKGIQILKQIITLLDLPYLKKQSNDFDRYQNYFSNVQRDWMQIFDTNVSGNMYRKTFIESGIFDTTEFLLPVTAENHISILPLDQDWHDWETLRPVRIIDHDSHEYTLNVLKDRIKFKLDTPSYAVFTIDPLMLGFMYFKYLQSEDFTPELSPQIWLHKYVIINLDMDLQDIWLRNEISYLLGLNDIQDLDVYRPSNSAADSMYGYIGLQYETVMKKLYDTVEKLRSNRIRPEAFLNSIELTDRNFSTYCNDILTQTHIPHLRQYLWQRYVRDMKWVELIFKVFMTNKNYSNTKRMLKLLRIRVQRMERQRFWDHIRDGLVKEQIKQHFEETYLTKL